MNSCNTAAAGPGEQNRPLQQWKHWHATDTLEVPLLKEEIRVIWQEQKQHVACCRIPTVCRKLQGKAANTASWATSTGNERVEIVSQCSHCQTEHLHSNHWPMVQSGSTGRQVKIHYSSFTQTVTAVVPQDPPNSRSFCSMEFAWI